MAVARLGALCGRVVAGRCYAVVPSDILTVVVRQFARLRANSSAWTACADFDEARMIGIRLEGPCIVTDACASMACAPRTCYRLYFAVGNDAGEKERYSVLYISITVYFTEIQLVTITRFFSYFAHVLHARSLRGDYLKRTRPLLRRRKKPELVPANHDPPIARRTTGRQLAERARHSALERYMK